MAPPPVSTLASTFHEVAFPFAIKGVIHNGGSSESLRQKSFLTAAFPVHCGVNLEDWSFVLCIRQHMHCYSSAEATQALPAPAGPNASVHAYAAAQVKAAMDATKRLGGENYVFWGGREGYHTLLNTNLKCAALHPWPAALQM